MATFAERVLSFNQQLSLKGIKLPPTIEAMNPFKGENAQLIERVTGQFYGKFYRDNQPRHIILGINPGRHGAGLTGTPFTDTKRLHSDCGIEVTEVKSHELSSVFVYDVINAMAGAKAFYEHFYIGNVCPLGFLKPGKTGKLVNYNYYDEAPLQKIITPFVVKCMQQQLDFGIERDVAFVMGKGKNFKYIDKLNKQHQWFKEILPLDHPRFIMQYSTKRKQEYVAEYVRVLGNVLQST